MAAGITDRVGTMDELIGERPVAMTPEQQDGHRRELQAQILGAIQRYERATGWEVDLVEYKPELGVVKTEVRPPSPR